MFTAPNLAHRHHITMDLPPSTPPPRRKGGELSLGRRTAIALEVALAKSPSDDEDDYFFFFFFFPTLSFPWGRGEIRPFWGRPNFFRPFGRMVRAPAEKKRRSF